MRIIIFANGELPDLEKARVLIQPDDFIICADGGIRHALALGLKTQILIGDMDSLPPNFQLSSFDGEVVLFPKDKNETDLELAIQHAVKLNPDQIVIVGALGGRIDQTIANISLLSDARHSTLDIRLNDGVEEIFFCSDQVEVKGRSGEIVSLIPWGGNVEDILTENLKWKLHHETLYLDKTRGISNEMTGAHATVSIKKGLLLIVHQLNRDP